MPGFGVLADAREALDALQRTADEHRVDAGYAARIAELNAAWDATVAKAYAEEEPAPRTAHPELGDRDGERAVRPP